MGPRQRTGTLGPTAQVLGLGGSGGQASRARGSERGGRGIAGSQGGGGGALNATLLHSSYPSFSRANDSNSRVCLWTQTNAAVLSGPTRTLRLRWTTRLLLATPVRMPTPCNNHPSVVPPPQRRVFVVQQVRLAGQHGLLRHLGHPRVVALVPPPPALDQTDIVAPLHRAAVADHAEEVVRPLACDGSGGVGVAVII